MWEGSIASVLYSRQEKGQAAFQAVLPMLENFFLIPI